MAHHADSKWSTPKQKLTQKDRKTAKSVKRNMHMVYDNANRCADEALVTQILNGAGKEVRKNKEDGREEVISWITRPNGDYEQWKLIREEADASAVTAFWLCTKTEH